MSWALKGPECCWIWAGMQWRERGGHYKPFKRERNQMGCLRIQSQLPYKREVLECQGESPSGGIAGVSQQADLPGVPDRVAACDPQSSTITTAPPEAPQLGFQAKVSEWLSRARTQAKTESSIRKCKKRLFSPQKTILRIPAKKVLPTASEGHQISPVQETSRKQSSNMPCVKQQNVQESGPSSTLVGCDNRVLPTASEGHQISPIQETSRKHLKMPCDEQQKVQESGLSTTLIGCDNQVSEVPPLQHKGEQPASFPEEYADKLTSNSSVKCQKTSGTSPSCANEGIMEKENTPDMTPGGFAIKRDQSACDNLIVGRDENGNCIPQVTVTEPSTLLVHETLEEEEALPPLTSAELSLVQHDSSLDQHSNDILPPNVEGKEKSTPTNPIDVSVIEIEGDIDDIGLEWETPSPSKGPRLIYEEPLEHSNAARIEEFDAEPRDLTAIESEVVVQEPTEILNQDNGDATTPTNNRRTRTRTPASTDSSVRKRTRNPALWKVNVRKTAKNAGLEYVSARGKNVSPKKMKPPCSCSMDCVHRLKEEQRAAAFKRFWELGNHERQWEYIRSHSSKQETKPAKEEKPKKRTSFRRYFFYNENGDQVRVCKRMFMSTLSICDSWIDSAYAHVNSNKGNTSTPDKRGRHGNQKVAITQDKINSVKEHVAAFPRVPSHYCRKRTRREYLENGLSLKKMSKLYAEWTLANNIPANSIASPRQYEEIVNSHFNLGFFKPKKDQCKLCCLMRDKHNTPELRAKYKDKWVAHIKNKEILKTIKEKDKAAAAKDRTIAICSYDLQKQLSCPKSEASPFFYKSKLNIHNFTVFNATSRLGHCYLWHQGLAKKGSNEVASLVFHFIDDLVAKGFKDLRFYSDNCSGQNKNRFIFGMYELQAVRHKIKITHKFLEPGHTMMEVDSIHARIELSTRGKEILDFNDWVAAITDAKEELPKYVVTPFQQSFVKNFKLLVAMQNWDTDLKGKTIMWSKVKEVHVNGEEGNLIRLKYNHGGEVVTMSPNRPGRPVNLQTYKPPQAYTTTIPLPPNTARDLRILCDSNAIPIQKQPFFEAVLAGGTGLEEETSEAEYETEEELCAGDTLENEAREETQNSENEDDM